MANELQGKRVAVLAADMFERIELEQPVEAFREAGADVDIVSLEKGEIRGFDHFDPADTVPVDRAVGEARPDDYDALYIPGGVGNPDNLRMDADAVRFVADFARTGKPIGAMCHGPWVLVEAGLAKGRRLSAWPSIRTDIRNAGGEPADEAVCRSGQFISSRGPDDLEQYVPALVEHFSAERAETVAEQRDRAATR